MLVIFPCDAISSCLRIQLQKKKKTKKKQIFWEEFVVENHVNWKFQVKYYLLLFLSPSIFPFLSLERIQFVRESFIVVARICSNEIPWQCILLFLCAYVEQSTEKNENAWLHRNCRREITKGKWKINFNRKINRKFNWVRKLVHALKF